MPAATVRPSNADFFAELLRSRLRNVALQDLLASVQGSASGLQVGDNQRKDVCCLGLQEPLAATIADTIGRCAGNHDSIGLLGVQDLLLLHANTSAHVVFMPTAG